MSAHPHRGLGRLVSRLPWRSAMRAAHPEDLAHRFPLFTSRLSLRAKRSNPLGLSAPGWGLLRRCAPRNGDLTTGWAERSDAHQKFTTRQRGSEGSVVTGISL